MDFLEALKFTVSVIRFIAVQLSDNISDIRSSIVLLEGRLWSWIYTGCRWGYFFFDHSKDSKDHALTKTFHDISPLKKTVNGHFLFRLQYNCPVFPSNIQDRRRSGQRFFDILILFCRDDLFSPSKLSHGRLPKYFIDGRTYSEPIRMIRMLAYRLTQKSPPSVQAVFPSCSHLNLLAVSLPSPTSIT